MAAASNITGWLAPVLLCASILFLGWSFYNIYGRGIRSRLTTTVTWFSLVFMIVFWTWNLTIGVW
jgi:hypothetical protein